MSKKQLQYLTRSGTQSRSRWRGGAAHRQRLLHRPLFPPGTPGRNLPQTDRTLPHLEPASEGHTWYCTLLSIYVVLCICYKSKQWRNSEVVKNFLIYFFRHFAKTGHRKHTQFRMSYQRNYLVIRKKSVNYLILLVKVVHFTAILLLFMKYVFWVKLVSGNFIS